MNPFKKRSVCLGLKHKFLYYSKICAQNITIERVLASEDEKMFLVEVVFKGVD